jgi:peroxiredoxin
VRVIGMGTRSQRYAMIVDDGRVEQLLVETEPVLDRSRAEAVLREL